MAASYDNILTVINTSKLMHIETNRPHGIINARSTCMYLYTPNSITLQSKTQPQSVPYRRCFSDMSRKMLRITCGLVGLKRGNIAKDPAINDNFDIPISEVQLLQGLTSHNRKWGTATVIHVASSQSFHCKEGTSPVEPSRCRGTVAIQVLQRKPVNMCK